ncbi:MAG: MerR family transcriptional regulator [Myxococcales bacterium]|nr:MerR family transcriptional regulator [Myxococcales bacterium]
MPTQLPVLQPQTVRKGPVVERPLKVGELAKLCGKTVRALHLYEEMGLLVPTQRSKGRYRMYDADAVMRVRWIAKLQDMGFSLQDIRTMSQQWEQSGSAPDAMAKVQALFEQKLAETQAQMQRLRMLSAELQASLEYLRTCPTCDPNRLIEACSACEEHQAFEDPPDLVAGFSAH